MIVNKISAVALFAASVMIFAAISTDDYITMCWENGIECDLPSPWRMLFAGLALGVVAIVVFITTRSRKGTNNVNSL